MKMMILMRITEILTFEDIVSVICQSQFTYPFETEYERATSQSTIPTNVFNAMMNILIQKTKETQVVEIVNRTDKPLNQNRNPPSFLPLLFPSPPPPPLPLPHPPLLQSQRTLLLSLQTSLAVLKNLYLHQLLPQLRPQRLLVFPIPIQHLSKQLSLRLLLKLKSMLD